MAIILLVGGLTARGWSTHLSAPVNLKTEQKTTPISSNAMFASGGPTRYEKNRSIDRNELFKVLFSVLYSSARPENEGSLGERFVNSKLSPNVAYLSQPLFIPDVAISKNDGQATIKTDDETTYVVTIINIKPTPLASPAILTDPIAIGLNKLSVTCTSASGNKCVNPDLQLTIAQLEGAGYALPPLQSGEFFEFEVKAKVTATDPKVTPIVTNKAYVTLPQGSNFGGDDDVLIPVVDLIVTKDDHVVQVSSGASTTYDVSVTNNGPSPAYDSTISDPAASGLQKTSIGTCTSTGGAVCPNAGNAPGELNIANLEAGTVVVPTIPVGGKIMFTITANVTATSGQVTNTFSASAPSGTHETNPGDNSAFDTDSIIVADLEVTKDDGVTTVNSGSSTTYTVTLTNSGPFSADGSTISDPAAAGLTKTAIGVCTPTGGAVCPSAGIGAGQLNIANLEAGTVVVPTLPVGGKISFTITANVTAVSGSVTNIFSATPPAGTTDPTPGNNTATDTDTISSADLKITKTDGTDTYTPGGPITYTIVVSNLGPSDATGISVSDAVPSSITGTTINCSPSGAATCGTNASSGNNVSFTGASIPKGAANYLTITVSGIVNPSTTGDLVNTATVTPGPQVDPNLDNNSSKDTDIYGGTTGTGKGTIEICKQLAQGDPIPVGTNFTFTVPGAANPAQTTITIPAGAFGTPTCTAPILVATGSQTITEVQRPNTIVSAITVNPSDPTDNIKLGDRSVTINVTESGVNDERVVTFTNQTTRTGYLEICKDAQGPDVTGSFSFTVEGSPGNTYSVPVGACSLPIEVTIPQVGNSPFTAKVTELKKENYKLVDVTTSPTNALNGPIVFDAGFDANGAPLADNTNGGYVVVNLTVGGTANQKIVHFVNQALPGLIKVCKITADLTNIPDGTLFTFTISGMKGPLPGTGATISFDVPAGPAPGYCAFAPETWIVGAPLFIGENGISTANTKPLPLDGNATGKGPNTQAALSVSSITSSTSFLPAPVSGYNFGIPVNPDFKTPIAGYKAYAAIAARNTTATMTFTNFVYRPAVLKLCKKSTSPTVPLGKPFNFTIEAKDPATSWPYPTQTITVPVGSCVFVNGPFPENVNFPGIGPFNYDTEIIVTETAAPGTSVSSITSPTGTVTEDLPNRKGTMRLNQAMLPNFLFNEMVFTNSPASGSTARRALSDFDGDGKSDIAVFRPTEGNWYWLSSQNSTVNAIHFGSTGDKIVPGDYDGDGKTDFAVWRPSNGSWYIQRSSLGFTALQFGTSGDLPAQADFDGDGKTDTAVFRPSNGTWYVMGSTAGFSAVQFGANGDKPVAADYDGDGKADIAVFRPSEGNWYVLKSLGGLFGIHFGISTDKVAPGDYDGDGKTDYAVYRDGSPGVWYLMRSTTGFTVVPFGTTGDIPAAGDFDGDGKTDVSVFRPSTGSWYLQRSTSGFSASQFGAASDKPVPAGYLPQQ
jgi:uncharacterized repeat protein (TIGR01451 family)